jgi:hypothetical protein
MDGMMKHVVSALALILSTTALACGGANPEPVVPTPPPEKPINTVAPAHSPLAVEYVIVKTKWVEKTLSPAPADVKAWSEDSANTAAVSGSFRHILVKVEKTAPAKDVDAAKKKAEGILARAKKGEDFATLAKQSDDPGSKDKGGEYDRETVKQFASEVRTAYDNAAPGVIVPELVRSQFGFHIVKKERAGEEQIERAYKKAKAPEAAKKLAEDLLARMKTSAGSREMIAEAVQSILGERASADPDRPKAALVERDRLHDARMAPAVKEELEKFLKTGKAGDVLSAPIADGDVLVAARAVAPPGK